MNKGISAFWQHENESEIESEENFPEREIWDIYDLPDNRLEKTLNNFKIRTKGDLMEESQYILKGDKLYALNNESILVFKIQDVTSRKIIDEIDLYDLGEEWLCGVPIRKGEALEVTDIIEHNFRLDYYTSLKEKNIEGIAIEKPHEINYKFD